ESQRLRARRQASAAFGPGGQELAATGTELALQRRHELERVGAQDLVVVPVVRSLQLDVRPDHLITVPSLSCRARTGDRPRICFPTYGIPERRSGHRTAPGALLRRDLDPQRRRLD